MTNGAHITEQPKLLNSTGTYILDVPMKYLPTFNVDKTFTKMENL